MILRNQVRDDYEVLKLFIFDNIFMKSKPIVQLSENQNKSADLERLFRTAKIKFANAYLSTDSGAHPDFTFDIKPNDFLRFAKQDFETTDIRGIINALTNAKRAIDCQTDKILSIFKIKYNKDLPTAAKEFIIQINQKLTDEKQGLQLFQALGLAPTILVSNVRTLRNKLEHNYESTSIKGAADAIELAELYIRATQNKITPLWDFELSNYQSSSELYKNTTNAIFVNYSEDDASFKIRHNGNEVKLVNTDVEFYYVLKASMFNNDSYELSKIFRKFLQHIQHPQSELKINVISENPS